jgi:hypothetical protein
MNELWIIFTLLLLIMVGCVVFIIIKSKQANRPNIDIKIENFDNNRLINNGSFMNGKVPDNYISHNGNFDVIVFPNTGNSSYVLRKSTSKKLSDYDIVYYRMDFQLKPATYYCFGCLYYSTKNEPLIHMIKYPENNKEYTLKTIERDNNKNEKFKYYYCIFETPTGNENVRAEFYIAESFNNMSGYSYMTDFELFEMNDQNNIPVVDNLRSYINSYNLDSVRNNQNIIKDLSNNGFDFKASIPTNVVVGDLKLRKNILTGPNAFKLQNKDMLTLTMNFTMFILVKSRPTKIMGDFLSQNKFGEGNSEEEEDIPMIIASGNELVRISGNQGTAVSLYMPVNYGKIYLSAGGLMYETPVDYPITITESVFVIRYDGTKIQLYLNQTLILEETCPKIYFDNKNVAINPNATYDGSLVAFAYYNQVIDESGMKKVCDYFTKINADMKDISSISSKMKGDVKSFIIEALVPSEGPHSRDMCPQTIFENGHYYVVVPEGSKLAMSVGYHGARDYGTDIDNAKHIFEINFPKCEIPDILDKLKFRGDLENCPFILTNEENPCKKYECVDVEWNKKDAKIGNKTCKKSVDSYCSKYANLDGACYCWKSENKDKKECLKFRGRFEDDETCDFRKFPIEKHPDSDKYIEKAKIPCWGCNLDKVK